MFHNILMMYYSHQVSLNYAVHEILLTERIKCRNKHMLSFGCSVTISLVFYFIEKNKDFKIKLYLFKYFHIFYIFWSVSTFRIKIHSTQPFTIQKCVFVHFSCQFSCYVMMATQYF